MGVKQVNVSVVLVTTAAAGTNTTTTTTSLADSFEIYMSRTNQCFEWYVAEATSEMLVPFRPGEPLDLRVCTRARKRGRTHTYHLSRTHPVLISW
jgi:hypothetical protein